MIDLPVCALRPVHPGQFTQAAPNKTNLPENVETPGGCKQPYASISDSAFLITTGGPKEQEHSLSTNNKLTPVDEFAVPPGAAAKYDILPTSVSSDSDLTLKTRRGTGYYKVPSLKGVWYRAMFGHSGWCATLEDWFDPKRVSDDHMPTGFKPYCVKAYGVKGHAFGLDLSETDQKALIAFLKTF